MKNKKLIGFIVAASLTVGTTATFAIQNQPADQSSQPGQGQPSPASPDQSQAQKDAAAPPSPGAVNEPAGAEAAFDKEKAIKEIAQRNLAEMTVAQMATQKAQDPQVKAYAQKLVENHTKVSDKLKELAQNESITLPTEIEPQQQKMMDRLSGLSGAEFDKAFAALVARDHKRDIVILKKAEKSDNPRVSEFAKETLPALEEHLRTAQRFAAGTTVEEPAGAEKQPDDANKSDQPQQTPDDAGTAPK